MKSLIAGALLTLGLIGLSAMAAPAPQVQQFCCLTQGQKDVLNLLAVVQIPDGQGGTVEALRVKSNLQVVNTTGSTATTNGLGNLIIGYNEESGTNVRTGSHNIVFGTENAFQSYGGLVGGSSNDIALPYSSVLGGFDNFSNNDWSVVVGGAGNQAAQEYSVVVGGQLNHGGGDYSVVVGGLNNQSLISTHGVVVGGKDNFASGLYSTAVGGLNNKSAGLRTVVVGGFDNRPVGNDAVIVGGESNDIDLTGTRAVLSGGLTRLATGTHDWVSGSLFEDN